MPQPVKFALLSNSYLSTIIHFKRGETKQEQLGKHLREIDKEIKEAGNEKKNHLQGFLRNSHQSKLSYKLAISEEM